MNEEGKMLGKFDFCRVAGQLVFFFMFYLFPLVIACDAPKWAFVATAGIFSSVWSVLVFGF